MSQGHIEYASVEGIYIFKLVGEVRASACVSFDQLLDSFSPQQTVKGALVDLTHATFIDSTVLGVLAKLGIKLNQHYQVKPALITKTQELTTLTKSMGLNQIFMMVECDNVACCEMASLPVETEDNQKMLKTVLEAHTTLANLSAGNKVKFEPLLSQLQNQADQQGIDPI